MATAPNAWTTSRVSRPASRPRKGAMSTPLSAANPEPMIQAAARTGAGSVPARASRSGLPTTARICTPSREKRRKARTPAAAAAPTSNGGRLLAGDGHAAEMDGRAGEERRQLPGGRAVAPLDQALDGEEQPHGGDDGGGGIGGGERAGEPFHEQAADEPDAGHGDGQRHRPRPAPLDVNGEEGERRRGGQRPMGEVEDTGRRVGQREARARPGRRRNRPPPRRR